MFCSKCGQENDNNARFCVQCREPFKSTNTISSHKTFSPADLRDGKLLDNGRYRMIGNRPATVVAEVSRTGRKRCMPAMCSAW